MELRGQIIVTSQSPVSGKFTCKYVEALWKVHLHQIGLAFPRRIRMIFNTFAESNTNY